MTEDIDVPEFKTPLKTEITLSNVNEFLGDVLSIQLNANPRYKILLVRAMAALKNEKLTALLMNEITESSVIGKSKQKMMDVLGIMRRILLSDETEKAPKLTVNDFGPKTTDIDRFFDHVERYIKTTQRLIEEQKGNKIPKQTQQTLVTKKTTQPTVEGTTQTQPTSVTEQTIQTQPTPVTEQTIQTQPTLVSEVPTQTAIEKIEDPTVEQPIDEIDEDPIFSTSDDPSPIRENIPDPRPPRDNSRFSLGKVTAGGILGGAALIGGGAAIGGLLPHQSNIKIQVNPKTGNVYPVERVFNPTSQAINSHAINNENAPAHLKQKRRRHKRRKAKTVNIIVNNKIKNVLKHSR